MANEVYELNAGDYKPIEVDWIKNDQRGNLDVDWEKWFDNEKNLLDTKVKNQLEGFEKNLMDNIFSTPPEPGQGSNPLRRRFIRDFDELSKQLSEAINNAKLGPASSKTFIGVAENLRTNEIDGIKQSLTIQGFDENLFPDGNVSVAYYDEYGNYTPKDSWTVENKNRASFITHNETGLTFKLDSKGLSFIDNNNFKINNKIIDYGEINTPRNVNFYPTGDEFDPMEGYDGPAYDAQTMDRDVPYSGDMADVEENIANEIDKQSGKPGMGMKALDLAGKLAGPVDETLLATLRTGIPKLFAGTALAGAAAAGGGAIATALMYMSIANLAIAGIRGAGTFAKEYGGDTSKAIDAILAGEIPEKDFSEAMKESLGEGFGEFTKQMEYDPFYFIVDKTILQPVFGKDQGIIIEKGMEGIQYLFSGQNQKETRKYGQYGVDY